MADDRKRLIEANALRSEFDDIPPFIGLTGGLVQQYVDKAPTVDAVEVVHGRWQIEWEYELDSITGECDESPVAICPFCGHKEFGFAYGDYWGKPYNYCPNCGAKMDGGTGDE